MDYESSEFLFTEIEDDVDDESLLISLDMVERAINSEEKLEEMENQLDSVWNDVSFCQFI